MTNPKKLGSIAFDVLMNDLHRPFVDGKCNRERISDSIFDGIYEGKLPPMTDADIAFVCDVVDDMIAEYKT